MRTPYPKALRIALKRKAWRLACAGKSQATIALELSIQTREAVGREVSQATVQRVLAEMAATVAKNAEREATAGKIIRLRQAELWHEEMLGAWEKSKAPKKKTKGSTSGGGKAKGDGPDGTGGKATSASVETTEREGDPVWVDRGMACIRLGLEILREVAPPKPKDEGNAGTVSDAALALAERRNAEYRSDEPTPEDATTDAQE